MDAEKLFNENQALLFYLFSKYRRLGYFLEDDDYRQIITLAFWKGCKNFDTKKGTLSSITSFYIKNALRNIIDYNKRNKRIKNYVELTKINEPVYHMLFKDECINILNKYFKGKDLYIMKMYFIENKDMYKIGRICHLSRERIRQIVYKNIKFLKSKKSLDFL